MPALLPPSGPQYGATCVVYARELLKERIGLSKADLPAHIPRGMQVELEQIVDRFHRAWNNPIQLHYRLEDALKVLETTPKNKDAELWSRFTGPFPENESGVLRLLDKPASFVDADGRVIGWYLPNAFTTGRSEHVYQSVKALSDAPKTVLTASKDKARGRTQRKPNWRDDESAYDDANACVVKPGHVNMSICWYNLGFGPQNDRPPSPSASLGHLGGGREFIASERDTNALIGVILALTHPRLYDLQMEVLSALHQGRIEVNNRERFESLLEHWTSPFTAFALIANRETPFHRDTKGGKMLLDLLATFGRYTMGRLEIPLLGSRFIYNPCTAVVLPGYILEHGAGRARGERICMASFFRPNVGYGALPHYKEIPPPHVEALADAHGLDIPWETTS